MRVIVFFDLPTITETDRRNYRRFRRDLIKGGFMMMQESVYSKLALNGSQVSQITNEVRSICPDQGLVQLLCVTEKQFAKMEFVTGTFNSDVIDSDERLLVL